jgi:TolB-like protein
MPEYSQAIFLSYASQDAEPARRICEALRAVGLEVWFDLNELRGGDAWDAMIRRQIRECALFVPLISANTDARSEGYFRLEWRLAVERMQLMADDQAFLVPVMVDDVAEATARVPDRFRERQWTRLPGGIASPTFVARVASLLQGLERVPPASRGAMPAEFGKTGPARRWPVLWLATAFLALGIGIATWGYRSFGTSREVSGTVATDHGATPGHAGAQSAKGPADAASVARTQSIAVLPFANISDKPGDAYLADGLQEEILNALARLRNFKVISRTSVMQFRGNTDDVRGIAQRLGVDSILEGSVRREGNKLRLTVQLIDARNDRHLLAANYDRDLGHLLDLQSAVARQVASTLDATLSREEKGELDRVSTNSGDAYDRYLRAVALYRRSTPGDVHGLVEPAKLLTQALEFDRDYPDALALLSQVRTWAYFYDELPADGNAAKQALDRALAVDPQVPETALARGLYAMYVQHDVAGATSDLESVVRVRPNSAEAQAALGYALRRQGKMEEALVHLERACELDPFNPSFPAGPITTLLGMRRYPEALQAALVQSQRFPSRPEGYFVHARIDAFMRKTTVPLAEALASRGGSMDAAGRAAIGAEIARAEKRYADAVQLWNSVPVHDPLDRGERIGLLYYAAGNQVMATKTFAATERFAQDALRRTPANGRDSSFMAALAVVQLMLGKNAEALASIAVARSVLSESSDAVNAPAVSLVRSIILTRAGKSDEGYAEVTRLLTVPFGAPSNFAGDADPALLLVKDDPKFDALLNHPPRL